MPSQYAFRFLALERTDGKPPDRVLLLRDGNLGWLGLEEMSLDGKSAQHIIDYFDEVGNDLPIDYHHATVKEETGKVEKAPAAGWVKSLEYVKGEGLYAQVTWSEEATKEIEAEQYKYISPVILHNEEGEILRLHSVALTNRPRTKDQIELLKAAELLAATGIGESTVPKTSKLKTAAAQDVVEEPLPMPAVDETQKLLADLIMAMQEAGLTVADDAPLAEVLRAAVEAIKGAAPVEEPEPTEEPVEETVAEEVKSKAAEPTTVPCKTADSAEVCALRVKAEAFDRMNARLKLLEDERNTKRVAELIEAEIVAGRILPDDAKMIAAARGLAATDEKQFKLVFGAMTPICEPGRVVASTTTAGTSESGRTPRDKLIMTAAEQYDKDGENRYGAKKRFYVAAALEDAGESDLTDSEVEQLEKAEA